MKISGNLTRSRGKTSALPKITIFANSHYVTPRPTLQQAIKHIGTELTGRLDEFNTIGKLLEAQRLQQRTQFDLEMIEATGSCSGIENYSRYLSGRAPGEPPPTLFEYLPENALLVIDESHVTVPQIVPCIKVTLPVNQRFRNMALDCPLVWITGH